MQVTFSGKSVTITDREREYAEKKLQRLARYFKDVREARLTHGVQRGWQIVEVQVDLDGTLLRAEERAQDVFAAIDAVADKLEHQVRRLKDRAKHHKGRADAPTVAGVFSEAPEEEEPASDQPEPTVARRKRFTVMPMREDEATLQMELLHHDFFVFQNADSGQVNVLYRRRDGNYGLLEVET
jgi:putative sigma-54 modulation protein